jgi:hypothetical protein
LSFPILPMELNSARSLSRAISLWTGGSQSPTPLLLEPSSLPLHFLFVFLQLLSCVQEESEANLVRKKQRWTLTTSSLIEWGTIASSPPFTVSTTSFSRQLQLRTSDSSDSLEPWPWAKCTGQLSRKLCDRMLEASQQEFRHF